MRPLTEAPTEAGHDAAEPLLALVAVMRRLRAECPWKAAQTHRSLVRYLLEETHEAVEALEALPADGTPPAPDADAHLAEELGDLLLQVLFHAAIAEEQGRFDLDDVARGLTGKLVRRNPHVFAPAGEDPAHANDPEAVNERWQQIKAAEVRTRPAAPVDPLLGLPAGLPALLLADKALDRLGRAGHPTADVVRTASGPGAGLLALVADLHASGIDPEQALREAVREVVGAAGLPRDEPPAADAAATD